MKPHVRHVAAAGEMNQGDLGAGGTVTQLPEPHVHQTTGLKSNSNACTYPVSKSASRGSSSNSYPTPHHGHATSSCPLRPSRSRTSPRAWCSVRRPRRACCACEPGHAAARRASTGSPPGTSSSSPARPRAPAACRSAPRSTKERPHTHTHTHTHTHNP